MYWNVPQLPRSTQLITGVIYVELAVYEMIVRLVLRAISLRDAAKQSMLRVSINGIRCGGYISNRSDFEEVMSQLELTQRAGETYTVIRDGENLQVELKQELHPYDDGYSITVRYGFTVERSDSFTPDEFRIRQQYFIMPSFRLITSTISIARIYHDSHGCRRIKQLTNKITPVGRKLRGKQCREFMALHRMWTLTELKAVAELIEQQHPLPAS